jgi:predicted enzyme related to lactoylglutathione lyase
MLLKPNPVVWFEIPVTDMPRATSFYETAFGIKLEPMEMGPMKLAFFPHERELGGAGGALVFSPPTRPSHDGTTVYFHVDSIDPVLESIEKAGGKTLVPRQSIGQYGFISHFEDSEGNRVSLHEMVKE